MADREIPNTNEIKAFLHCRLCMEEEKSQDISVGWTPLGLQVWCDAHDCNILHVDFQGQKHPANTTAPKPKDPDKVN